MKKNSLIPLGILSTLAGLYPIIYFLVDRKFGLLSTKSAELLSNNLWNFAFYGHIILGGLALLIGWLQFSNKLRINNIKLHRTIGKTYMVSVLISGACGLVIAINATGGIASILGFLSLDIIWLGTTIFGFTTIKKGVVELHRKFMIFSYAACFSAVTLRIWLPVLTSIMGEFIDAYRIVAWLSWIPNIIVAFIIISRKDIAKFKLTFSKI